MSRRTHVPRNQVCAAQICVNQDILKPEIQVSHLHESFQNQVTAQSGSDY